MNKILFIDRDALIQPRSARVNAPQPVPVTLVPGAITHLADIVRTLSYEPVLMPSIQASAFAECISSAPLPDWLPGVLAAEGIRIAGITGCGTAWAEYRPAEECHPNSLVIGCGDKGRAFAERIGCRYLVFKPKEQKKPTEALQSWRELAALLKGLPRSTFIRRTTRETDISLRLNLDGSGLARIHTGLGFLDHMLEQLAFHGSFDLDLKARGDLYVDEHHTVEDCGLVLGEAFRRAAGKRIGIQRYAFVLPMDESLASVALDFGERPCLVWKVGLRRETIGDVPTEMFPHFFKSFCDTAHCTLHCAAGGDNEHHIIEAVFKAWARALAGALHTGRNSLASTTREPA